MEKGRKEARRIGIQLPVSLFENLNLLHYYIYWILAMLLTTFPWSRPVSISFLNVGYPENVGYRNWMSDSEIFLGHLVNFGRHNG